LILEAASAVADSGVGSRRIRAAAGNGVRTEPISAEAVADAADEADSWDHDVLSQVVQTRGDR
jgi:hypothetical protein